MKTQVLFCILFVGFLGLCQALDIGPLLKDRAYVEGQIKCVLGRAPCDLIGEHIVALTPDALNHNCGKCTEVEAAIAEELIKFMKLNYPEEWLEIVNRYPA